jgi:flavin-dependent thymidylate synthase
MIIERVRDPQSDLTVVNAARVSFHKVKFKFTIDDDDRGLIRYLYTHKHWSPFAHAREVFEIWMASHDWLHFFSRANLAGFEWNQELTVMVGSLWAWIENHQYLPEEVSAAVIYKLLQIYPESIKATTDTTNARVTSAVHHIPRDIAPALGDQFSTYQFRVKAPITVARQLVKHQVHVSWNEVSRRYVDDAPEIYPQEMRLRAENVKQGSHNGLAGNLLNSGIPIAQFVQQTFEGLTTAYEMLIESDVAPECARGILPVSMMTEWIWTASRRRFAAVCDERLAFNAQKETRLIAQQLAMEIGYGCGDMPS